MRVSRSVAQGIILAAATVVVATDSHLCLSMGAQGLCTQDLKDWSQEAQGPSLSHLCLSLIALSPVFVGQDLRDWSQDL